MYLIRQLLHLPTPPIQNHTHLLNHMIFFFYHFSILVLSISDFLYLLFNKL